MKSLRLLVALGLVALLANAPRPALAQWNSYDALMSNNSYSRGWVNPYNNTMSNIYQSNVNQITSQAINRSLYFSSAVSGLRASRRDAYLKKRPKREQTEAERFLKYKGTVYTPGPSNSASQIAAMFAKNADVPKPQMQKALQELWLLYVKQAKSQNAPPTDLARTIAYCISANYYYYTGGTGVPETQVAALRGKLREALSESPKFRAMSNAEKQRLNESLVMLTHFAALGFEVIAPKAGGDKKAQVRQGFKTLAGANLKGILGVDPSRVGFDKEGLVIKV